MTNKTFFKRITDNRLVLAIVSVIASMFLWMFVISTEGTVSKMDFAAVPLVFLNEEMVRESSGFIVTEPSLSAVTLTLSGPRRVLNQLRRLENELVVTVDLRTASYGVNTVLYDVKYPSSIDSSEIEVSGSSVSVVRFVLDRFATKPVEVVGVFSGSGAEGYVVEDPIFDPLTVRISGPANSLSKVEKAVVEITRTNIDQSFSFPSTYELLDENGEVVDDPLITLETPEVSVTVNVLVVKEVPLDVNLIAGGGATGANALVSIDPKTVVLVGDAQTISEINRIVLATVDLAGFIRLHNETYNIVIPDGTESLTGITAADVAIEIKGLSTRRMTLTNIEIENVAAGHAATVQTESISVNVRGPEEVLLQIEESDLRAVADLTELGATTGRFNPVVRIYIDGFPNAGVVGSHKVYIELSLDDT